MQKGFLNSTEIDEKELELINKFTKRPLKKEEVYAFSVVLCDNDIDRDFERFTPETLEELSKLYLGKTGIFDHSMKGKDQVARIYFTQVQKTNDKTCDGKEYIRLFAKAYLPRTSKNEDFILSIDAGIMKEVSVGCSVAENICSICGTDKRKEFCSHQKGKFYGEGMKKEQCHIILNKATDAYEWSFVAVPAQRKAGVVKSYKNHKEDIDMSAKDIIKNFGFEEVTLSAEQTKALKVEFERLDNICKTYFDEMKKQAIKNISAALPKADGEVLSSALDKMDMAEIKMFAELKSEKTLSPQLKTTKTKKEETNSQFVI